MVHLIAHRGASYEKPENTLSSIKHAIEIGVDFIELDVHLSLDKIPVVIHDGTLSRTTDAEEDYLVRNLPVETLKTFDAGARFMGQRNKEQIPTLEEVLQLPLGNTGLMIEIKEDRGNDLCQAVLNLLHRYPHPNVLIGSFSPDTLKYFYQHAPHIPLIGIAETEAEVDAMHALNLSHLAVDHNLILQNKFKSAVYQTPHLWSFTIDDQEIAKILLGLGIEGIITNNPRSLKLNLL